MHQPTIGSLFAGIGGFDVGFENAGYRTAWQVELNPINRAVLADRFPHARQFEDVRECGAHNLSAVDVITAGFPCQDISIAGSHAPRGLQGERSGLFWEVIRILKETQPRWVVLENVVNLLAVNDSRDFETVIRALADCGYVGFWRVLNAQYFGVPSNVDAYSWSPVIEKCPPSSSWLTPRQWTQYLQRLNRSPGHGPRMPGLPILYWQTKPDRRSLWAVPLSSLNRTDGIRWLSGSERLKMMGFASDWMRPTLRRLLVPEMPLLRRWRSGLGGV